MGFIKHAIIGIALYEGLKYWARKNAATPDESHHITLGGKQFSQTEAQPTDARHRHHLDRPEIIPEIDV